MYRSITAHLPWVAAALLLLAGPLIGLATNQYMKDNARTASQAEFESRLSKQVFLFEKQIHSFVEVVAGLKSFFESSDFVSREEFASFCKYSIARYPDIQALEWIPMVTNDQRPAHEKQARTSHLENYRITAMSNQGSLVAAPTSSRYFPVYYVEPLAGNRPALGYDLSSEITRRKAIYRAIDQTEAVLSAPVSLVQSDQDNTGILIFLRVQVSSAPGLEPHENLCEGLVLLVLNLHKVIESTLLADAFLDPASYAFDLRLHNSPDKSAIFYTHPTEQIEPSEAHWVSRRTISASGQSWDISATPQPEYITRRAATNPALVGTGVATIWGFIWLAIIALSRRYQRSEIEQQKEILDSVLLSMAEGVIVADAEGRIILTNHAAALQTGFSADLQPNGVATLCSLCKLPDKATSIAAETFPLTQAINGEQVRDKVLWVPPPNPSAKGAWLSANAAPLLRPDGGHRGGVLVLRDITKRKRALEFTERLNNAVEQTDDGIMITDRYGTIEYVNAGFEKVTGYSRTDVLDRKPSFLKSGLNTKDHYKTLWDTILRGEVYRGTIINRKKSGHIYHADHTITPMRDLSGRITHFVSVSKDMTEYRQLQRREIEMEIAIKVQRKLFPSHAPPLENWDLAGSVFSADGACGDYFDFIPISDNEIGLVVGDVSGHGIGPALVMAETRAYVRSLSPRNFSPGEIMSRVNRNLIQDLDGDHFVTLVLAHLDIVAGHLVYASAGHDTCYIIDADGQIKAELNSSGLPLGILDLGGYGTSPRIAFETGDILIMLTDGIVDCQAHLDRFLSIESCLALVHRFRQEPAAAIINHLHDHIRDFMNGEPQNDDITIVICKAEQVACRTEQVI